MNPILGVLLLVGVAFLVNAGVQAASAASLNFTIDSAQVQQVGLSPTIALVIQIQNPSNASYTINSLSGNFYINGTLQGNVSSFTAVMISANSEQNYPVTVQLQAGAVIQDIINLFNGNVQTTLRLVGTANAGVAIPFDISYTLI